MVEHTKMTKFFEIKNKPFVA